ncbi:MAG: 4Fe-4S binding protein [Campylobacterales bacterium]
MRKGFLGAIGRLLQPTTTTVAPYLPGFRLEHSDLCRTCTDPLCQQACKEGIIRRNDNGVPVLTFQERGCTFCGECATACPSASSLFNLEVKQIDAIANIDPFNCLAWHQTVCSSCRDRCLYEAIVFEGWRNPIINIDRCTGCGWCISPCPTQTITMRSRS